VPPQIQSYSRGLLVRAVDPLTRGRLHERLELVGTTVHTRSFLDPPKAKGHTIKGSGLVAFRDTRWNSESTRLGFKLTKACDNNLLSCGVQPDDYNYGRAIVLNVQAVVSLNGRRWRSGSMCEYFGTTRQGRMHTCSCCATTLQQTRFNILRHPPRRSCPCGQNGALGRHHFQTQISGPQISGQGPVYEGVGACSHAEENPQLLRVCSDRGDYSEVRARRGYVHPHG
jgi:hypothetical protein